MLPHATGFHLLASAILPHVLPAKNATKKRMCNYKKVTAVVEAEESYINGLVDIFIDENKDLVSSYVNEPKNSEQLTVNEFAKDFVVGKVRRKLLESFMNYQHWFEDKTLVSIVTDSEKLVKTNPEIDILQAMERVMKQEQTIKEMVESKLLTRE